MHFLPSSFYSAHASFQSFTKFSPFSTQSPYSTLFPFTLSHVLNFIFLEHLLHPTIFHPSIILILSCICLPGLDVVTSWRAVILCNQLCYFCRVAVERIEKIRNLCKCNPLKTKKLRVLHM